MHAERESLGIICITICVWLARWKGHLGGRGVIQGLA
jgi:hypothetical protein